MDPILIPESDCEILEPRVPRVNVLDSGDEEREKAAASAKRKEHFESLFPRVTVLDSDDDDDDGEPVQENTPIRRRSHRNTRRLLHLQMGNHQGEEDLFWVVFKNDEIAQVYADKIKRTLHNTLNQNAIGKIKINDCLTGDKVACLKAARDIRRVIIDDLIEYLPFDPNALTLSTGNDFPTVKKIAIYIFFGLFFVILLSELVEKLFFRKR